MKLEPRRVAAALCTIAQKRVLPMPEFSVFTPGSAVIPGDFAALVK